VQDHDKSIGKEEYVIIKEENEEEDVIIQEDDEEEDVKIQEDYESIGEEEDGSA
jgi:hypothetical protein